MKVDRDHSPDTTIEVEAEHGEVKAEVDRRTTVAPAITGTSGTIAEREVPVRKLKVQSVKMLSSSCN